MRTRVNLVIDEELLTKIDSISADKNKRAATIETALREFIEREEVKQVNDPKIETSAVKIGTENK